MKDTDQIKALAENDQLQREKHLLLSELTEAEHRYNQARQECKWDVASAYAMQKMNLCRRLFLLEQQEKAEAV